MHIYINMCVYQYTYTYTHAHTHFLSLSLQRLRRCSLRAWFCPSSPYNTHVNTHFLFVSLSLSAGQRLQQCSSRAWFFPPHHNIYTFTRIHSLPFSRSPSGGRRWQRSSSRVSSFFSSPSQASAPNLPRLSHKGTCVCVCVCSRSFSLSLLLSSSLSDSLACALDLFELMSTICVCQDRRHLSFFYPCHVYTVQI